MKHPIATLVIFVILVTSSTSIAYAGVKTGAACAKVGTVSVIGSKKFTCIKSAGKLIWDKGKPAIPGKKITYDRATQTIKALDDYYYSHFGLSKYFIEGIPELRALTIKALGTYNPASGKFTNTYSLNDWIWNYQSTTFWRQHSETYLMAEMIRVTDPCTYVDFYNQTSQMLRLYSVQRGFVINNLGDLESCGQIHAFNTTVTTLNLSNEMTVTDWFLHTFPEYWVVHNRTLIQDLFVNHGYLFLLARWPDSASDPQTWNAGQFTTYLGDEHQDISSVFSYLITNVFALARVNHIDPLTGKHL